MRKKTSVLHSEYRGRMIFILSLFILMSCGTLHAAPKLVCYFMEFNLGGVMSGLGTQNMEIDGYNRSFSANGWTGEFGGFPGLSSVIFAVGFVGEFDWAGNLGLYLKYESISMNSGLTGEFIQTNYDPVEKVYYPTGELAAVNEVYYAMHYVSAGIRKYWLGPWERFLFNFYSAVEIGGVFGASDMILIRRVIYNTDGSVLENASKKMGGKFLGMCAEAGFLIPSNFGIAFELKAGYMYALGVVKGDSIETLDLSGLYIRLGINLDLYEEYKKNMKKNDRDKS